MDIEIQKRNESIYPIMDVFCPYCGCEIGTGQNRYPTCPNCGGWLDLNGGAVEPHEQEILFLK